MELVITILVVATVVAMALPSFSSTMANGRQTSAVNTLINSLQYARNGAMRGGQPIVVCPTASQTSTTCSADWNTGWGVVSTPAVGAPTLLSAGKVAVTGVTIKSSGGASPITFTPRGLVSGLPATGVSLFTFCDSRGSAYARSVLVNVGGYVQNSETPGLDPNGGALTCP
ncbi:MAG: GspH/FimT family pseudopilin [Proteobacteria bacterium]|nr:GspH/FimT family pseudopilin [Pseudomonadota bacterium]